MTKDVLNIIEVKCLIWSNEHRAWWGSNHVGYTNRIEIAGRYSQQEAIEICNRANYHWNESTLPDELPIPEYLALQLQYKQAEEGTA